MATQASDSGTPIPCSPRSPAQCHLPNGARYRPGPARPEGLHSPIAAHTFLRARGLGRGRPTPSRRAGPPELGEPRQVRGPPLTIRKRRRRRGTLRGSAGGRMLPRRLRRRRRPAAWRCPLLPGPAGPADTDAADPASWRRGSRSAAPRPERPPQVRRRGRGWVGAASGRGGAEQLQSGRSAGALQEVSVPAPPLRLRSSAAPRRPPRSVSPGSGDRGASVSDAGRPSAAMAGLSRTLGIFGCFVAVVGAAFYPIYFRPLLLPEEYSECPGRGGGAGRAAVKTTRNSAMFGLKVTLRRWLGRGRAQLTPPSFCEASYREDPGCPGSGVARSRASVPPCPRACRAGRRSVWV